MAAPSMRESILRVATRAFVKDGPDAVSVATIARGSGAAVGSIYHHFSDKAGLQLAVAGRVLDGLLDGFLGPALDGRLPLVDRLITHSHAYVTFAEERPGEFRLLTATSFASHPDNEHAQRALQRVTAHLTRLTDLVVEGQERGVVRPGDPGTLVLMAWSSLYGLCHLQSRYSPAVAETAGPSPLKVLAEQITREAMVLVPA